MKALLLAPIALLVIMGFMTQLSDIAMSTSEKALNFADDMDNAMGCASRGIPVEECSPNLNKNDFTPEKNEFIDLNKKMIEMYGIDLEEELKKLKEINEKELNENNNSIQLQ